jgi:uncharacterized protein (TIGR02265 family)
MFFRSVLEVMWALGDEASLEHCVEVCGGQRKFADFTCYPTSDFLRLLWTAARLLGTGYGDFSGAMRALGRRGATDFFASSTGRPLQTLLAGNPRRLLESLPVAYAAASSNGGQCVVAWAHEGSALVRLERDFLPRAYVEGALTAALEVVGTREPKAWSRLLGPLSSECVLSWG